MISRLRVLLLEPNRYQALLIDREISAHFSSAVTATFASETEAVKELRRAQYDVIIVDSYVSESDPDELYFSIREASPEIVAVIVGGEDAPSRVVEAAETWGDWFIVNDEGFHELLPEIIEQFASRWQQSPQLAAPGGILDARTRADVISLTVSTLSHEVNNPLMAILGTTELLLNRSEIGAEDEEKIRMIQESAQRIEATLSDLAQAGKTSIRRTAAGPMLRHEADLVGA